MLRYFHLQPLGLRPLKGGLLFALLLALFSCNKTEPTLRSTTAVELPTLSAETLTAEEQKQQDLLAFTDRPTGQLEVLGQTLYDYGVYLQDTHEPFDLLAPPLREPARQRYEYMTKRYGHIEELSALASELERDSLLAPGQSLDFYVNFVEHVNQQPFTSFGQFWFYMTKLEQEVQNSATYADWQKRLLLNYCVVARHTIKYAYAQGMVFKYKYKGDNVIQREECSEIDCMLKVIGKSVLIGALEGFIKGLLDDKGIEGAIIGALVGYIKGIINGLSECQCDYSECRPPLRYHIAFNNCNLSTQQVIFINPGPGITSYQWVLYNGTAAEFGGGTSGITFTPSLVITQTSHLPVRVVLLAECEGDNYYAEYIINIRNEVAGGTLFIEGPSPIAAGSEVMYSIAGTCLANPFNTNYYINVLNDTGYEVGTVTTNSGTSCVIRWNYMAPETHGDEWWGNVAAGFTNQCVNANRAQGKQVIITRSGPGQSN